MEEGKVSEAGNQRRVREALSFVELEHTIDRRPSELSGGMRAPGAIARAIITPESSEGLRSMVCSSSTKLTLHAPAARFPPH